MFLRATNQVVEGDYVLIVGVNAVVLQLDYGSDANNWANALRFSRVQGAQRVVNRMDTAKTATNVIPDDCIYHGVPTYFGISGAGIISFIDLPETGSVPTIGGIHIRDGLINISNTKRECGRSDFNVGIQIPQSVLDTLNAQ